MLTNLQNGKFYIGRTNNLRARWRTHIRAMSMQAIHRAIQKYGADQFAATVIADGIATREEAINCETLLILYSDALNPSIGYNRTLTFGGNTTDPWNKGKTTGIKTQGAFKTGHLPWNKGKRYKYTTALPHHTCPNCGMTGRGGVMKRYHFENCGKDMPYSPETIRKRTESRRRNSGYRQTAETREKIRLRMLSYWAKRKGGS